MEKITWERPQTIVQQFVANEYVAACDSKKTLTCNAGYNTMYNVNGDWTNNYTPCGMTFDVSDATLTEVTLVSQNKGPTFENVILYVHNGQNHATQSLELTQS